MFFLEHFQWTPILYTKHFVSTCVCVSVCAGSQPVAPHMCRRARCPTLTTYLHIIIILPLTHTHTHYRTGIDRFLVYDICSLIPLILYKARLQSRLVDVNATLIIAQYFTHITCYLSASFILVCCRVPPLPACCCCCCSPQRVCVNIHARLFDSYVFGD